MHSPGSADFRRPRSRRRQTTPRHSRSSNRLKQETEQQFREFLDGESGHRYLIHDRDSVFSAEVDAALNGFGLKVLKTPVRSPMANAYCERVVGSIRRECLDYLIPLNARHLKRILREFISAPWMRTLHHFLSGHTHLLAFLVPFLGSGGNPRECVVVRFRLKPQTGAEWRTITPQRLSPEALQNSQKKPIRKIQHDDQRKNEPFYETSALHSERIAILARIRAIAYAINGKPTSLTPSRAEAEYWVREPTGCRQFQTHLVFVELRCPTVLQACLHR